MSDTMSDTAPPTWEMLGRPWHGEQGWYAAGSVVVLPLGDVPGATIYGRSTGARRQAPSAVRPVYRLRRRADPRLRPLDCPGTALMELRRAARLTQAALGYRVGYSQAAINRMEWGEMPLPSRRLPAFAAALGISLAKVCRQLDGLGDVKWGPRR